MPRVSQSRAWTATWIVAAWALLATDLLVPRVNISSAYVVALGVFLLASRRDSIWRPALVMSACVFVGYLLKPNPDFASLGDRLASLRLANRFLVTGVLLSMAALAHRLQPSLEPDAWRKETDPEGGIGDETLFHDAARSTAGISAIALLAAILLFEILAPVALNLTLLAPIALLLALQTRRRHLVLAIIACIVVLPLAGYALEALRSATDIPGFILVNRIFATVAWTGLSMALYFGAIRSGDGGDTPSTSTVQSGATLPSDRRLPLDGR